MKKTTNKAKKHYFKLEVNVLIGESGEHYRDVYVSSLKSELTEEEEEEILSTLSEDWDLGYCKLYGTSDLKTKPKHFIDFELK